MTVAQTTPSVLGIKKISGTSEKLWLPVEEEFNGTLITNSAGMTFPKPNHELHSVAVYHITEFKGYSDTDFRNQINALNQDTWNTWQPYQAWISEIHWGYETTIGNDTGFIVHYVVRCTDRNKGWRFTHHDTGFAYNDGSEITAFDGYIGNLNGAGGDGAGAATLLQFDTKKRINFGAFL